MASAPLATSWSSRASEANGELLQNNNRRVTALPTAAIPFVKHFPTLGPLDFLNSQERRQDPGAALLSELSPVVGLCQVLPAHSPVPPSRRERRWARLSTPVLYKQRSWDSNRGPQLKAT